MSYKFKIGDRVHYRVYPSGTPNTECAGTVVGIDRTDRKWPYRVYWDGIERTAYPPSFYSVSDLAAANGR